MTSELPVGFESLAPFARRWACDTLEQRLQVRSESTMEEIRAFYDTMLPLVEEAVASIDTDDLNDMPADKARLAKLVLALVQAAVAVEMHGQPTSPGTPYPNSIRVLQGLTPFA